MFMRDLRKQHVYTFNDTDVFHFFFLDENADKEKPPFEEKLVERNGFPEDKETYYINMPDYGPLSEYRIFKGKIKSHYHDYDHCICYKNLTEHEVLIVYLSLDIKDKYTFTSTKVEHANIFEEPLSYFTKAEKQTDRLTSKRTLNAIKKDPLFAIIAKQPSQKLLFNVKSCSPELCKDKTFVKLVDEAIKDPHKLSNKKLRDWFAKQLHDIYETV
jgi:hypothetical protein